MYYFVRVVGEAVAMADTPDEAIEKCACEMAEIVTMDYEDPRLMTKEEFEDYLNGL